MSDQTNPRVYEDVTAAIVQAMETAGANWAQTWVSNTRGLVNPVTGHEYAGILNHMILGLSMYRHGWPLPLFAGFKQWKQKGASVNKGAKAVWILRPIKRSFDKECPDTGAKERVTYIAGFKSVPVFNLDQVSGAGADKIRADHTARIENLPDHVPVSELDAFIRGTGADIVHGDERAYYVPSADRVCMPDPERFQTPAHYYATVLHELTHWTGHKSRLDRFSVESRKSYGFEELVAELGAAYLGSDFGIVAETREDHAKYLNAWIGNLKADPKLIFDAAKYATAAARFMHGLQDTKTAVAA